MLDSPEFSASTFRYLIVVVHSRSSERSAEMVRQILQGSDHLVAYNCLPVIRFFHNAM